MVGLAFSLSLVAASFGGWFKESMSKKLYLWWENAPSCFLAL
jgi:hypothetical protein